MLRVMADHLMIYFFLLFNNKYAKDVNKEVGTVLNLFHHKYAGVCVLFISFGK
jgi:hypothetical protein